MNRSIHALFLTPRLFGCGWAVVLLFVAGYPVPVLFALAKAALCILLLAVAAEIIVLFRIREGVKAHRTTLAKWSNGDPNPVTITVENRYPMALHVRVLDELPVQFQERGLSFRRHLPPGSAAQLSYAVRPLERGTYAFGAINVLAGTALGLVERRYREEADREVAVYPSYLQLRKYELLAIHDRLTLAGVKKVRRIAQNVEFDRIKEYIPGDDRRTVNWKATARRGRMMVNLYQDEKAQQVFSLIDMGRTMRMPFNGLSLLDHAINAALVISDIAIRKEDRAGAITFSSKVHSILPASRQRGQMQKVLEMLHAQRTDHAESDLDPLHIAVERHVHQRSLLLLFTNFESVNALRRQLPQLQRLARKHLLLVIFFQNTELEQDLHDRPADTEMLYARTITEKYLHEKRLVAMELERHGIGALLTRPEELTTDVINRYLGIKARGQL